MVLDARQIQGVQLQSIYQRVAKELKEESAKKFPELAKKASEFKNKFLTTKDIFINARKSWLTSKEHLDYLAKQKKINHISFWEKTFSSIKPLKKYFDEKRGRKRRVLESTQYALEKNPESFIAKRNLAEKNNINALNAYKVVRNRKNRAFAETVICDRLEKVKNFSTIWHDINTNIKKFVTEKKDKLREIACKETVLKHSEYASDEKKAKKVVDRGRRTFLQFIKRVPKEDALKENKKALQEAEERYRLLPEHKDIETLKNDVKSLIEKIKNEAILKKYYKPVSKDVKTRAIYEFVQEAGKNIEIK